MHLTIRIVYGLLDAHIGEHVLAKYRLGVQVGRHEPALARQRLLGRQTLHVRRLDDVLEILVQVFDVGVDNHFVFPFEHDPHLEKFLVVALRWYYVVHDVDVDVIEDHTVAVTRRAAYVVDDVAENDAVLGGRDLKTF